MKSKNITYYYDRSIVPLLHRMNNLEKLTLCLTVSRGRLFIDGITLQNDIVNSMRKLNSLIFNIQSSVHIHYNNPIDIPSNEYIKQTFKNFPSSKIISTVDFFPELSFVQCHVYSYPYTLEYYENIANSFPGGLFPCVRQISLTDEQPFEHEFFLQIAKAFPFLQRLSVENFAPQNSKTRNDNQHLEIIEYPHLIELDLYYVDDHYVEQFLCDSKARLFHSISLKIAYQTLERVTNKFTRDQTRTNWTRIEHLRLDRKLPENFHQYFPNVKSIDH